MSEPTPKPRRRPAGRLAHAVQAPPDRPSVDSFLDHVFQAMGGSAAVARYAVDEFLAAKSGSLFRLRFLESLLRTLKSSDQKNRDLDGPSMLTDDDLRRAIEERELRLLDALRESADAATRPVEPGPAPEPPAPQGGATEGPPAPPAAP